jgi:hypothetical protein
MTVLTAVQTVCLHPSVGIPSPGAAVGSSDPTIQDILALFGHEANELRLRHDWSGLKTPATFTLGAKNGLGVISANLPADFRRLVQDSDLFSVELRRSCTGPLSSGAWINLTRGFAASAEVFWRRVGNALEFFGATAGWTVAYEYVSSYPWLAGATPAAAIAADTDTLRVPEELAILGVIWRFRAAKGLDYSQERATYESQILNFVSDDRTDLVPVSLSQRSAANPSQIPFTIVAS